MKIEGAALGEQREQKDALVRLWLPIALELSSYRGVWICSDVCGEQCSSKRNLMKILAASYCLNHKRLQVWVRGNFLPKEVKTVDLKKTIAIETVFCHTTWQITPGRL